MRPREEAFRILEATLSTASQGVDGAEVALAGGERAITRFDERGVVESSEHALEKVSIRIAHQGGIARVITSDFSTDGIQKAVDEAKVRVQRLQVGHDAAALLPDPQPYPEVASYDAETAAVDALERTTWASRAILAGKASHMHTRGVITVERGAFEADGTPQIYAAANTRGLLAYQAATHLAFELEMFRPDGGYAHVESGGHAAYELEPDELVAAAIERADVPGPRAILPTGSYVAVLDVSAVARLIRFLGLTCGARITEGGASFLSDNLGRRIVDERVSIVDDFSHPAHRGLPFDVEGVARQRVPIIERGIAERAVYAWGTAVRHDGKATGHRHMSPEYAELEGAEHLVMSGTDRTLDDLVENVDVGVYVADFADVRLVDTQAVRVTGVTRGAMRIIDRGALVGAAEPMRFEVGVIDLLDRLQDLGASRWSARSVVPPLVVRGMPLYAGGPSR